MVFFMIIRLAMIAELVAITAALAMPENQPSWLLASIVLATAALVVATFLSSASLGLARLLRPGFIVVLAAPALWMALQAVPMPMGTLGNPIWATASAALNEPLAEAITVDIGATMFSFAQYCAVLVAALVTAAITLDRYRAAQVLHVLLGITTVATAVWFGKGIPVGESHGSTVAVLGVLLSCATAIRAVDQLRRHSRPEKIAPAPLPALFAATIAMITCMAVLLIRVNATAVVAALLGSAVLLSIFAIRRWFLGAWGTTGVLATTALFVIASVTAIPFRTNTDPTIALSTGSQTATERMLQDAGSAGSGAGASTVLLPIYRDVEIGAMPERPTVAAAIVIDMGWTFLCGLLLIAMLGACILIKRSLSRAYDYEYPALGAGALVALTILAFADHGILGLGASLLVAALLGLAFGQSLPGAGRASISSESKEDSNWMAGPAAASRSRLASALATAWPRVALMVLGIALIIQAAWIVVPDWYFGGQSSLAPGVSIAARSSGISKPVWDAAAREDSSVRGALRSSSDAALAADEKTAPPVASNALARALRLSPLRGDIWLLLAAASKHSSTQSGTAATLKMSYYTAPNDLDLLPLRLSVALATDAVVREHEFRDLIKRDVSLLVTYRPAAKSALLAAYRSASDDGKVYLESLISELDPTYLDGMRARNSRQGFR